MTNLMKKGVKGRSEGVTPLHIAAKTGNALDTIELLKTVEPDPKNGDGQTPLWMAAAQGHAAIIRELIAAGANPDQDDTVDGLKPLHKAVINNHHDVVAVLLEAGVDPLTQKTREQDARGRNNTDPAKIKGCTPLMLACQLGNLKILDVFVSNIKDVNTIHRALAWAAVKGRSAVVARLVQYPGVDVNARSIGVTPLFLACGVGDLKTISTLLQAGANPNIESADPFDQFTGIEAKTCYCFEISDLKHTCLKRLCDFALAKERNTKKADEEKLQILIALLVQNGADVNHRGESGQTVLHLALRSTVLTRLLLDAGADADAVDENGSAPLHKVKSTETMVLLVEKGKAKIDSAMRNGKTPLLCMLSNKAARHMVLKFLEYGPNGNVLDNDGNNALHIYLRGNDVSVELVKTLLELGANPNFKNSQGRTPLFSLRNIGGAEDVVNLLLEAGANVNATDKDGETLLFQAVRSALPSNYVPKHPYQNLETWIRNGASVFVRDYRGRTLLHEAVKCSGDYNSETSLFQFLIRQGLDIKAVDHGGNGMHHELALRSRHGPFSTPYMLQCWEELVALGLDLDQRNYSGYIPLHLVCREDLGGQYLSLEQLQPISFVISHTKNINAVDKDGVTPLHMAVATGEYFVKKLLDENADPMAATHEGLTPLHLAAICRESNNIGLLLDAMRQSGLDAKDNSHSHPTVLKDTSALSQNTSQRAVAGVDAKTYASSKPETHTRDEGLTPLFYACRSGRMESVALLLEAGADATDENLDWAIATFEEEDKLWQCGQSSDLPAFSPPLRLNDSGRPRGRRDPDYVQRSCSSESVRLDEILDMLIASGNKSIRSGKSVVLNNVIHSYGIDKISRDYTAVCLRAAQARNQAEPVEIKKPLAAFLAENLYKSRMETSIQVLRDSGPFMAGTNNIWLFSSLIARKEYHLIKELHQLTSGEVPESGFDNQIENFSFLVEEGYTLLVKEIGTLFTESRVKTGDWHAFGHKSKPGLWFAARQLTESLNSWRNPLPLLYRAVRRRLPNMGVVRILVEKFDVDVNEMCYTPDSASQEHAVIPLDSTLHRLAQGSTWWHVHQALPYLIKAGVDLNCRDNDGCTPLHVALQEHKLWGGPYDQEAAAILIEAGADVHAVNNAGQNCLDLAQGKDDIIKLLMRFNAAVAVDTNFSDDNSD